MRGSVVSVGGAALVALGGLSDASAAAGAAPGQRSAPVVTGGRFQAYLAALGEGAGQSFIAGQPLHLVFRDARAAHTRYRVCWGPRGRRFTRCWQRTTGSRGQASKILTAAPGRNTYLGYWRARWYVGGKLVASRDFVDLDGE